MRTCLNRILISCLLNLMSKLTLTQSSTFFNHLDFESKPGAHSPERATFVRSGHGVFTDQFIFRTVLGQI